MKRDSQEGKPAFQFLLPDMPYTEQPLTRWAMLMERGAKKYGPRNWQLANSEEELERFKASALRHMFQYQSGETDEDHMAAVMYNLMAAEYVKYRLRMKALDLTCPCGCGITLSEPWNDYVDPNSKQDTRRDSSSPRAA